MFVLPALPLVVALGVVVVVVVELDELGDMLDEDELGEVLDDDEVSAGVEDEAPPLIELDGELGEVEEVLELELGVLGVVVVSVVVEVLDEGVVDVVLLLRSQPVTAAVATASTATRGMSLFMTSPFRNGCDVGRSLTGPVGRCVQHP